MDLLIVESTAKASTLERYLGDDYLVRACRGHVQDLPQKGEQGRKGWWANEPGRLPEPPWEWTEGSEKLLFDLIAEAEQHDVQRFFVGSDPDREGEFIAWRLTEILEEREVYRVSFREITEEAVREALRNPREVDMDLVDSACVRRFMDRLVGYRGSKFAKSWFSDSTSMGRVQTPALGFIVDRELEREAFVPIPFFRVTAEAEGISYSVRFHEQHDPAAWTNEEGRFYPDRTADRKLAQELLEALRAAGNVVVTKVEHSEYRRNPAPPFTTETLLGAAGSELGWSPPSTMATASELYNAGHITYIRTDSTRTGEVPRGRIRALIADRWGQDHLGPGAEETDTSGTMQDAHEAIRPSRPEVLLPEGLEEGQERLYRLVWARFAASQMSPSRYHKVQLTARLGTDDSMTSDRRLEASVTWQVHAGWEAAYEGLREPRVNRPPATSLEIGAVHVLDPPADDGENPRLIEDATRPPARYRQHTLIRQMKEEGIGRPSTYASTVKVLFERGYCTEEGRALVPTEKGRTLWLEVVPFYEAEKAVTLTEDRDAVEQPEEWAESNVFSSGFTAEMESVLDSIEAGLGDAPSEWETFRDRFRAMHDAALKLKKKQATPKQIARAQQLLSALDEEGRSEVLDGASPAEVGNLSGQEISQLISKLLDATDGVVPPSEKQLRLLGKLTDETGMTEAEAASLVGAAEFSELTGGKDGSASALIDRLLALQPASEKQLKFLTALAAELGLDEAEACGLVEAAAYSELTGGDHGTASALIDQLKAVQDSQT